MEAGWVLIVDDDSGHRARWARILTPLDLIVESVLVAGGVAAA